MDGYPHHETLSSAKVLERSKSVIDNRQERGILVHHRDYLNAPGERRRIEEQLWQRRGGGDVCLLCVQ